MLGPSSQGSSAVPQRTDAPAAPTAPVEYARAPRAHDAQEDAGNAETLMRRRLFQLEREASRLRRRTRRVDKEIARLRSYLALMLARPASPPSPGPLFDAPPFAVATAWVRQPGVEPNAPAPLRVFFLGTFRLFRGDIELHPDGSAKVWRVIKRLLALGGGPVSRDVLVDTFWRRSSGEAASQSVYSAMHSARRLLGGGGAPNYLLCESGQYQLAPGIGLASDVQLMRTLQTEGRRLRRAGDAAGARNALERAVAAYTGPFLADDPYESWASTEREALAARHIETLELLAELCDGANAADDAAEWRRQIVELDPLREDSHRALIAHYATHGQRTRAVQQYQLLTRTLKRELGITPDDDTRAVYERAVGENTSSSG